MDLERFLELADANRKSQTVGTTPLGKLYEQLATGKSALKFSVVNGEAFVAIDGFARALRSY